MEVIDTEPQPTAPSGREMTRWEQRVWRSKLWFIRLRRRLPHLVWWNDELDVCVTLSQDKLPESTNPDAAFGKLFGGAFFEAEKIFYEMGIGFDTGMGSEGRDWEWDWSLKGPIHIKFRGRARHPEKRIERPRPQLIKPAA